MFRGMQNALNRSCGASDSMKMKSRFTWTCGEHNIRMYEENDLLCFPPKDAIGSDKWALECPSTRRDSKHMGLRLGLFPAGQGLFVGRPMIGWSRFSSCETDEDGCGSGGHLY